MSKLKKYRKEIDKIDNKIIKLISERFETVQKIWKFKKENNIEALQEDRWKEVIQNRKSIAENYWISTEFIEKIWNEIHKETLELQK